MRVKGIVVDRQRLMLMTAGGPPQPPSRFTMPFQVDKDSLIGLLRYLKDQLKLYNSIQYKFIFDTKHNRMAIGSEDLRHLQLAQEVWPTDFPALWKEESMYPPPNISGGFISITNLGECFMITVSRNSQYFDERANDGYGRDPEEIQQIRMQVAQHLKQLLIEGGASIASEIAVDETGDKISFDVRL